MLALLIIELALPLVLFAWLAVRPLHGGAPLALQIAATALVLLLVGVWPAWWLPAGYWLSFGAAALVGIGRTAPGYRRAPGRASWLAAASLAAVGLGAGLASVHAWTGRSAPQRSAIDLNLPLGAGRYHVVNGGFSEMTNSHLATLARLTPRQRAYYGQSYGVDLVKVGPGGFTARGLLPEDPARYAIFGEPILAPCSGTVVAAVDGLPDMRVPQMDSAHLAGNHVLLRCGRADILLAHMKRGSVRVRPLDTVYTGDRLGEVGNSGNSSLPHLHIHAQTPGTEREPFAGEPIPIRFNRRHPIRGDRL